MSRRASVFARQNPGKRRVRFPDEVVFEDEIKEQDGMAVMDMLRRASIDIDINRINSAGQKSHDSSLCMGKYPSTVPRYVGPAPGGPRQQSCRG